MFVFNNIESEWFARNFHRESTEQQRLSKMDTNTLSSCCDRSIMGEQLSKMNSISTVSQYKCLELKGLELPVPSSLPLRLARESWQRETAGQGKPYPQEEPPWERPSCHMPNLTHCETTHFQMHTLSQFFSPFVWPQKGDFNEVSDNKQYSSLHMLISQATPKCLFFFLQ